MNKRGKNKKKGQVTIFIIIAILLVIALIIIFYPRIKMLVSPVSSVSGSMDKCVEKHFRNGMQEIMRKGGSIKPEHTFAYEGEEVEYLCYTNENFKMCSIQQPMLKQHIEQQLEEYLKPKVEACVNSIASEYERKGYEASVKKTEVEVKLVQGSVRITANSPITLTKGSTESYTKFNIVKRSAAYDFAIIASSILNWEARYGDADIATYMMYYPDMKVEKYKQGDGSKIYILTDKNTKESFMFATRGRVFPGGYGFEEITA